ncbi:hypothetical protein [uncultured Amnibacterium sp.]|uniref:hypothetical protein n=1 Tax=uncultured Amnibacterium sp. TaxID=1631851 RepID=UPI0035CBE1D7
MEQWEELSKARESLNEWLLLHPPSIRFFSRDDDLKSDDAAGPGSYYSTVTERDKKGGISGSSQLRV